MPENCYDSLRAKVKKLFEDRFSDSTGSAYNVINAALREHYNDQKIADEITFHLNDWIEDASFLVALHHFPNLFTPDEVDEGIQGFLIHAPNHIAAAATLGGWPMKDIFNVGAKIEPAD